MKKVKITKTAVTVVAVTVVALNLVLCSAGFFEKSDCQIKAETFLSGMLKGEIDKSYDEILTKWLKEAKPQEVQVLKSQTERALETRGKLLGYEFIKQQKYGNCLVRMVYVIKSERVPFTFEFYFYKTPEGWSLVKIKLSDEYDLLADK
jgi:hypothetical protein